MGRGLRPGGLPDRDAPGQRTPGQRPLGQRDPPGEGNFQNERVQYENNCCIQYQEICSLMFACSVKFNTTERQFNNEQS